MATSTTRRPSDHPFDAVGALGFGRGRWLVGGRVPGMGGSIAPTGDTPHAGQEWLRSRYAGLTIGSRTGVR